MGVEQWVLSRGDQACSVLTSLLLPRHTGQQNLSPSPRGHVMGPGNQLSGGDACYFKPTIKGSVCLSSSLIEQT
jgi:hypothetical protein